MSSGDDGEFEADNDEAEEGGGGEFLPVGTDEEIDFYALLNVPHDASVDEINRAYRQRCLVFHPDRHTDPTDRKDAEKVFVMLRRAHETLIDPEKRAIYDTVGIQGLDLRGWELIAHSGNADEIRREYEFLNRLRDAETMLQRIRPGGTFVVKSSFIGLLAEDPEDRYPPQLLGINLAQSVETSLTNHDRLGLTGRVRTSNGQGDGSMTLTWKRSMKFLSVFETYCTFTGDSIGLAGKIGRNVFSKSIVLIMPTVQYSPLRSSFDYFLSLVYTQSLSPSWQGSIAMNFGGIQHHQSITTTMVYLKNNQPKLICNLTVSPKNSQIRIVHTHRPANAEESFFETACAIGTMGLIPSINYEWRLSRFSRLGTSVTLGFPSGLLLAKFRLKSGYNVYEWHVQLCNDQHELVRSTVLGVLVPIIAYQLAKRIFYRLTDRIAAIFDDRSDAQQVNALRRDEAGRTIELMRSAAERIMRVETGRHGLVIVEARYGQLLTSGVAGDPAAYPMEGDTTIDVVIPLQAMVNDSQLRVHNAGKDQLPGFYDPCPGTPKMLRVIYRFRDELHSVIVLDEQPLTIPLKSHRLHQSEPQQNSPAVAGDRNFARVTERL